MWETVKFMIPPFLATFLIVGMHSYLGIHVLKRGIIFIDLSFAQLAALGTLVGLLFGFSAESSVVFYFSLAFILVGAFIFSFVKSYNKKIPQEAIIGIVYGLAIALAMVIADKISGGGEHIREILTGNLLWVNWQVIAKLFIVYFVIALIHFIFRQRITGDNPGIIMDLVFFVTFGIVITLSVPVAGVLLVFSFLIIPATISTIFFKSWQARIFMGWIVGSLAVILGLWYSYVYNAPSGPATICSLAVFLAFALMIRTMKKKEVEAKT